MTFNTPSCIPIREAFRCSTKTDKKHVNYFFRNPCISPVGVLCFSGVSLPVVSIFFGTKKGDDSTKSLITFPTSTFSTFDSRNLNRSPLTTGGRTTTSTRHLNTFD